MCCAKESSCATSSMSRAVFGLVTCGTSIALCFATKHPCRRPNLSLRTEHEPLAKDCRPKVEKIFILGILLALSG
jgi:hypothetical protein